jgi:hypothetical protein
MSDSLHRIIMNSNLPTVDTKEWANISVKFSFGDALRAVWFSAGPSQLVSLPRCIVGDMVRWITAQIFMHFPVDGPRGSHVM